MPAENWWLSVPFMESLFDEPQFPSKHSLAAAFDPKSVLASDDFPSANSAARKRRGHTKSRFGCFSCKKRKIKCQETWPSCANCMKHGCTCRYPTAYGHMQNDRTIPTLHYHRLSDTPTTYSGTDMRLFHHFLVAAHPRTQPEYKAVWIGDIAAISYQYDYLMYSILALSASHLSIFSDDSSCRVALSYRQKAITGLEEAFGRWPPSALEAHIMLATSYLLAAQSTYISDGFLDHILSLRGCALLSRLITNNRLKGAFSIYPRLNNIGFEPKPENFPAVDQLLARHAFQSLIRFSHHLNAETDIEKALFAQLVDTIHPLLIPIQHLEPPGSHSTIQTEMNSEPTGCPASCTLAPFPSPLLHRDSPTFPQQFTTPNEETRFQNSRVIAEVPADHRPELGRSFNALVSSFLIPVTFPRDAVLRLYSPSNKLGNIVMAHHFVIHFIVSPLCTTEGSFGIPVKSRVEWVEQIIDAVEDDEEVQWTKYMELPSRILRVVRFYLNQKRGLTFGDIYAILIKDPGAFREGRLSMIKKAD